MSFIDLLANDIWSEADILRRTEAIIRSEFSTDQETVLNRKATAVALGQYVLSNEEESDLASYANIVMLAQSEGELSRLDMDLLIKVMKIESGEELIEDASQEVKDLFLMRNPT